AVDGRMAVRTPMQWAADDRSGFSTAPPEAFLAPPPDGDFGPAAVNVAAQKRDPGSLLNWFERMIRRRRECPELGLGTFATIATRRKAAFAHRCDWAGACVVVVHNLDDMPVEVCLDLE